MPKNQILTIIGIKRISEHLLLFLFIIFYSNLTTAQCSKSGPNNAASFANDNSIGTNNYSNPSNAQLNDGVVASGNVLINLSGSIKTHYLKAQDFSFAIPLTATICGIEVEIERNVSSLLLGNILDNSVRLVKAGVISGNDKASATTWPLSESYASYGSNSDLWGLSLTPPDINSSNFGVVISAKPTGSLGLNLDADINHIRLSVYYNIPLPVTFQYFKTSLIGNTANLEWKMDYYDEKTITVQRSSDAVSWEDIKVYGLTGLAGTNTFSYNDDLKKTGPYFYRLMLTSITDKQEYSLIKSVNFQSGKLTNAFPVPSASICYLNGTEDVSKIIVTDINQRVLKVPVEKIGNNLISINLSTLPKGLYFVRSGEFVQRLVKN